MSDEGARRVLPTFESSGGERQFDSSTIGAEQISKAPIDFISNDYLGLARDSLRDTSIGARFDSWRGGAPEGGARPQWPGSNSPYHSLSIGSTGSRLMSGNRDAIKTLEAWLAEFHESESALLFNSGFEANTALIGAIGDRNATIFYDEYIHASMREGIRVGFARAYSFRHNNIAELESLLSHKARGDVYVLVESVYSMDGDLAPLEDLLRLRERYPFHIIVDEAHSLGVYGEVGEGITQAHGYAPEIFARVYTFGKALGFRGACIAGSQTLIDVIINRSRPFIYSTAPDLFSIWYTGEMYRRMTSAHEARAALWQNIRTCNVALKTLATEALLIFESPIFGVIIPGNQAVISAEDALFRRGILAKAVRSPTVPRGKERIRLSVHASNTSLEIECLVNAVAKVVFNSEGAR